MSNSFNPNNPRALKPFMLVSPSLVISVLKGKLLAENPGLTMLFDPTLEFIEVMRGRNALRSQELFVRPGVNTMLDPSEPLAADLQAPRLEQTAPRSERPNFPILAFNRTQLTGLDSQIFRGSQWEKKEPTAHREDAIVDFGFFNGHFDLNFRYYAADSAALEAFELFYSTGMVFKNHKKLTFDLEFLKDFLPPSLQNNWFVNCEWYPLTDIQFNNNPAYFSISGMVRMTSGFLAAKVQQGYLIEVINLYLENELDPGVDFRLQEPWISAQVR